VTGFHYPSTRAVLTGARFHFDWIDWSLLIITHNKLLTWSRACGRWPVRLTCPTDCHRSLSTCCYIAPGHVQQRSRSHLTTSPASHSCSRYLYKMTTRRKKNKYINEKSTGWRKNGANLIAIFWKKLHDRISWKLMNLCKIICWTQSLISFLFKNFIALWRHLAKTQLLSFIHTVQIYLSISQ